MVQVRVLYSAGDVNSKKGWLVQVAKPDKSSKGRFYLVNSVKPSQATKINQGYWDKRKHIHRELNKGNAKGDEKARLEEIEKLQQLNVYVEVVAPPAAHITGSKWVMKIKWDLEGMAKVPKARLVVQGYSLKAGVDFTKPTCLTVLSQ